MQIGFIRPGKAFLPEIEAYTDFFTSIGFEVSILDSDKEEKNPTPIEWHFMGTHFHRNNKEAIIIHEYPSSSTPPFAHIKNLAKKAKNCKPDFRIFLNEYVRDQFAFQDTIPHGFRDMGIPEYFLKTNTSFKKEFDFIYTGDISTNRNLYKLFECFAYGSLSQHSLLILSRDYNQLLDKYAPFPNIRFEGPVKHSEVPEYLQKSRFAVNFIPFTEPFSHQTSTKFLEYASLQIPIITTRYKWIEEFQLKYGGSYFYLDRNLENFTWENVSNYDYSFPELSDWRWKNQIERSGVLEFIHSKV
jgi:glycosyltransferase involved in cell wall biosynthesis